MISNFFIYAPTHYDKEYHPMKTTDQKTTQTTEKPGQSTTRPTGAVMVPLDLTKRSTKHRSPVSTILRQLSQFEWNFEAMKRV